MKEITYKDFIQSKIVSAQNKTVMFKDLRIYLQTLKERILYKEIKRNTCSTAKKEKKNY